MLDVYTQIELKILNNFFLLIGKRYLSRKLNAVGMVLQRM